MTASEKRKRPGPSPVDGARTGSQHHLLTDAAGVSLAISLTGGHRNNKYRRELWARGVKPQIALRGAEHGSHLGTERWVVERTFAWLHNFRASGPATSGAPICTKRSCCSAAR